jgi:hypothetical protein
MSKVVRLGGFSLASVVLVGAWTMPSNKPIMPTKPAAVSYQKDLKPTLEKYCGACHNVAQPPSDVNPLRFKTDDEAKKAGKEWERVLKAMRSGHMPPKGLPAPPAAEKKQFLETLEKYLLGECGMADPGRVTLRRLNRAEYSYTVKDLLGVDFDPTDEFPSDDVGYGFDNIGDVLTTSPLLMEKYLDAAETIASQAIFASGSSKASYPGGSIKAAQGGNPQGENFVLFSVGDATITHEAQMGGSYRLVIRAAGAQAGNEPCRMAIKVNGQAVQTVDVPQPLEKPTDFEFPIALNRGENTITASFLNDYYNEKDPNPKNRDRNLVIFAIEVVGPIGTPTNLPPTHLRLIPQRPAKGQEAATAKVQLAAIANRAFRRPATAEELNRLVGMVNLGLKQGESYERSMQLGLTAMLVSPQFLFRAEIENSKGSGDQPLNNYEIASRLSYFLWSSTPDDELLARAKEGKLTNPAELEKEVDRMLADPKSRRLADTFMTQWMQLGKLKLLVADKKLFPSYSNQLKEDLRKEATSFFNDLIVNDRSFVNYLNANYVFVNDRLAKHYGIEGVEGSNFRRVVVTDGHRGGLVGMGSVLMLTSNPTRTSPTKRGRWILDQVLGEPPPPPPPGLDVFKPNSLKNVKLTMREQMELHRSNPSCANCHARMDPLGLSLENYDALGQWRDKEEGEPVDASGELPDGTKFTGPKELRNLLLGQKEKFVRSFTEKMLTFALGRGTTLADQCHIDAIYDRGSKNDFKMSSIIKGIVTSEAFRSRRPVSKETK